MTKSNIVLTTLVLFLLAVLTISTEEPQSTNYDDMKQWVNKVAPLASSTCKHGATLVLLGRNDETIQYEADFGRCMRQVVHKVITQ
jgi:hypothetical protein